MTDKKTPPIEEMFFRNGKRYEITIAPSNSNQFLLKERKKPSLNWDRFTKVWENLHEKLAPLRGVATFYMYWELSEYKFIQGSDGNNILNNYPRYHLHGYITFKDAFMFQSEVMAKIAQTIGNIQLNKVTHPDYDREKYWGKYIRKQEKFIRPQCKKRDIPYIVRDTSHLKESATTILSFTEIED